MVCGIRYIQFSYKVISFRTPLCKSGIHCSNLLKFTYNSLQFHYYLWPKNGLISLSLMGATHSQKYINFQTLSFLKNPCPCTSNFQYISTFSACKCLPKVPIKFKPCQPSLLIVNNSLFLSVVRNSMIFVFCVATCM